MDKPIYEFVKKYFEEQGCILLENKYINNLTKMKYICNCKNESTINWSNFKRGSRCKNCAISKNKPTYEFVKNEFKKAGCILLENKYTDGKTKIKYICNCGKEAITTWSGFKQGYRCKDCGIKLSRQKVRLNHEFIANYFEQQGCKLLEKYISANIAMKYICNCGNKSTINWSNFKRGYRCKDCGVKKRTLDYNYIKKQFEAKSCMLLEDKYTNSITKMEFICECGNKSHICWTNFRRRGGRCKQCGIKKTTDSKRFSHDFVKSYFEKHNCILLSEYKNSKTKMEYICSCGEKAITIWPNFSNGSRCKNCFAKRRHRNPNREIIQLNYNLSVRCLSMIRRILKITNDKQTETMKLLNYTAEELRIRLTSHPNWNNIKDKKWAIDHVFPINAFVKNNILDIKLINCLENLRPITSSENFSKNAKYNQEDFIHWLKTKGIILETHFELKDLPY